MEIKYQYVLYIGIGVLLVMIAAVFINIKGKDSYKGGKKVAGTSYIKNDPYFIKRMRIYKILSAFLIASCIMSVFSSFIVLARPCKIEKTENERYSRDIMLCLDISASVDYLNENLVDELKDTVKRLQGERFGIVIFNTSPVLISPLTDDYEFIIEQLDMIKECLAFRNNMDDYSNFPDDWMYLSNYISSGTLVGVDERGSSLIGDGLAAAVYDFPELDEERTRIIIFSSDNDLQGEPIVTLDEAADICVENNVVVYGIGTKEMYTSNIESMEAAVTKTGGKFYLEEDKNGTFDAIVKDIEKQSKSLVKGDVEIMEIAHIKLPFIILVLSILMMFVFTKLTKK